MTISKQPIYLLLSGLTLTAVGFYIAFIPMSYLSQFVLVNEIGLDIKSEMRGMGGSLLTFGVYILTGAFYRKMAKSALMISILIYSSFSIFRILGILLDGVPSQSILMALSVEVVFALTAIWVFLSSQQQPIQFANSEGRTQ